VEAVYNGLLCPPEGDGVWCSRQLVNVRDSAVIILSADPNWDITLFSGRTPVTSTVSGNAYIAYVSDLFNSKPTAGSTVSISATAPCVVDGQSSFDVPNTTAPGAFTVNFTQSGEVEYDSCNDPVPDRTGEITISLTPNGGGPEFTKAWVCTARLVDTAPDPLCP
jgi:hypothetical protein